MLISQHGSMSDELIFRTCRVDGYSGTSPRVFQGSTRPSLTKSQAKSKHLEKSAFDPALKTSTAKLPTKDSAITLKTELGNQSRIILFPKVLHRLVLQTFAHSSQEEQKKTIILTASLLQKPLSRWISELLGIRLPHVSPSFPPALEP